jgi:hypothetical protein
VKLPLNDRLESKCRSPVNVLASPSSQRSEELMYWTSDGPSISRSRPKVTVLFPVEGRMSRVDAGESLTGESSVPSGPGMPGTTSPLTSNSVPRTEVTPV